MYNKKMIALVAAAALAACLALVGCGGSQAASSSAAASSAASDSAASASAASESAAASSEAASASSAAASASAASASSASAASYLPAENAIDIALADAGLSKDAVTDLQAELDLDDAVVHYDVDFKYGGMEYDYDIDATTGAILQAKSEVDD